MQLTGTHTINAEQLKLLLQERRTSKPRFRLPLTKQQAEELLLVCVQHEVEYRHQTFRLTPLLQSYISRAASFLTEGKRFGLLVCGVPGNGKTTLMRSVASLINAFDLQNSYGTSLFVRFVSAKDIVRTAKQNYGDFKKLCEAPALAIDDFGEEPVEVLDYGNVLNPVIDLLSIRYDRQLLTLITTNTANDKIRTNYGDRIADRFNEMMQVIIFSNPSYRGNKEL